uniref:Uncharacterized protein n=1 Tax=Amphimedon queenslandica TaxID=400682 RepID=A0A1X7ULP0_AMPQE
FEILELLAKVTDRTQFLSFEFFFKKMFNVLLTIDFFKIPELTDQTVFLLLEVDSDYVDSPHYFAPFQFYIVSRLTGE